MPSRAKGFTLIELMIVIAIIAVIAAIAIPNLLAASKTANETAALGNLRGLASAQYLFRKTDYYGMNNKSYAVYGPHLFEIPGGRSPHLIDRGLSGGFNGIGRQGYFFRDNGGYGTSPLTSGDSPVYGFDY